MDQQVLTSDQDTLWKSHPSEFVFCDLKELKSPLCRAFLSQACWQAQVGGGEGGGGGRGGRGMGGENTFLNWSVTQLWIPPGDQRSPRTNVIQTTFLSYPVLVSQKTNREGKISISYKTFQSHIHTAGLWKSDIINQVKIYFNFHMWPLIPLTHHLQYIFSKHTYCGL